MIWLMLCILQNGFGVMWQWYANEIRNCTQVPQGLRIACVGVVSVLQGSCRVLGVCRGLLWVVQGLQGAQVHGCCWEAVWELHESCMELCAAERGLCRGWRSGVWMLHGYAEESCRGIGGISIFLLDALFVLGYGQLQIHGTTDPTISQNAG